jgi:hypothetical protein
MQLVTFEHLLIDRLNASGQVEAKSYHTVGVNLLYGIVVRVGGGTVAVRLTKGAGTGDPAMTEDERAEHEAYVVRAGESKTAPRSQATQAQVRKLEDLIRDVLAADLPQGAVRVEGPADGRERPGVKVVFSTGAEIYLTPNL